MRKRIPLPSQADLRRLFDYSPDTGQLIWRFRPEARPEWNTRFSGQIAGSLGGDGRSRVFIDRGGFLAHRLIFKMLHDQDPADVDHINGNPSDNRVENLRAATRSENLCNSRARERMALPKGVSPNREGYRARIQRGGKQHHLGTFATPEGARLAWCLAAVRYHGAFARFH